MQSHINKIDLIRGIAILLVLFYHCHILIFHGSENLVFKGFFIDLDKNSSINILVNILPTSYGWTGVQLFLIVSGFLIHYGTIKRNSKFDSFHFYNKRFWRIYPPYFIAMIITAFFYFGSIGNFLTHLLLIHNLRDKYFFGINPSFWSLALEAQLYLVYPIYLFLYKKYGANRALLVISSISILALIHQDIDHISASSYETSIFKFWIIWVAGAHLAHTYYNGKKIFHSKGIFVVVFSLFMILFRLSTLYIYNLFPYLASLFYLILIEWLLYKPSAGDKKQNVLFNSISHIGIVSYSIYLMHQPIINAVLPLFASFYGSLLIIVICLIVFVLIYLISTGTYKIIELQSISFGERFYNKFKKISLNFK